MEFRGPAAKHTTLSLDIFLVYLHLISSLIHCSILVTRSFVKMVDFEVMLPSACSFIVDGSLSYA
jgi:hypothetical protein